MPRSVKPRQVSEAEEKTRVENAEENADNGITQKRTGKVAFDQIRNMPPSGNEQEGRGMGGGKSARNGRSTRKVGASSSSNSKAKASASGKKGAQAKRGG